MHIVLIIVGVVILAAILKKVGKAVLRGLAYLVGGAAVIAVAVLLIRWIIGHFYSALLIVMVLVLLTFLGFCIYFLIQHKAERTFANVVNAHGLEKKTENRDACTRAAEKGLVLSIGRGVYMAKPLYEKLKVTLTGNLFLRAETMLKLVWHDYPACRPEHIAALMEFLLEKGMLICIEDSKGEPCFLTPGLYARCKEAMERLGTATESLYRDYLEDQEDMMALQEELTWFAPAVLVLMQKEEKLIRLKGPEEESCFMVLRVYTQCKKAMDNMGAATAAEYRDRLEELEEMKTMQMELTWIAPALLLLLESKKDVRATPLPSDPNGVLYISLHQNANSLMTAEELSWEDD